MERAEHPEGPGSAGAPPAASVHPLDPEAGQGMVEYGLILGLMVLAGVAGLTFFGEELTRFFGLINSYLVQAMASATTGS